MVSTDIQVLNLIALERAVTSVLQARFSSGAMARRRIALNLHLEGKPLHFDR